MLTTRQADLFVKVTMALAIGGVVFVMGAVAFGFGAAVAWLLP